MVFLAANLGGLADPAQFAFSRLNGQVFPQLFTYIFVHHDSGHLLANMLGLWVFGRSVENQFGTLRFLALFTVAGVVAASAQGYADGHSLLVGSSGAIAGVMAAFLRAMPFARLYLFGILPMPAWLLILIWLVYNILGVQQRDSTIAFAAHLAGFGAGLALTFLPGQARLPGEEFD